MKFIEDIRDRHKGEEIWVIGAGPSLDDYPINFFKDKICVGVNWVFSVFLKVGDGKKKFGSRAFYSVHAHRGAADWIAKRIPHFLKNCFFLLPPSRRQSPKRGHSMVWWKDYNDDPYYMRWGIAGGNGVWATDRDFKRVAKCMAEKSDCHYFCRGTTLHWAIQVAVVLGAKKIYLVGAEARGDHMHGHGSLYLKVRPRTTDFCPTWHEGTRWLARALQPYGHKVVYYYYGKGEQAP